MNTIIHPECPPKNICILRLSAIGDVCHAVAVAQLIQRHYPQTKLTWVIGKTEAKLVSDLNNIEFIIFDKTKGLRGYIDLKRQLKHRSFDILLHMQVALRANIASYFIPAKIKIGFDRSRSKDFQWLFTNHAIEPQHQAHVIEGFLGFAKALGITEETLNWDIPISEADLQWAKMVQNKQKICVITPAGSQPYRNWTTLSYAKVAEYAMSKYDMQIILCGGNSSIEQQLGQEIQRRASRAFTNLIGQTSLKQLLALLKQATLLIAPDTGPAHMATMVGTPVIGLYAVSNPGRTGPYLSQAYVVNRYDEALRKMYGQSVDEVTWGKRIKDANYMDLITVEDVIEKIDSIMDDTK